MKLAKSAYEFAKAAHEGVFRMGSGEPYVEHVARVAQILAALDFPEDVIAAAYLHDVIEDTPVSVQEIVEKFGSGVAALVVEVSNPSNKLEDIVEHLAGSSYDGASIKLADMLDNSSNLVSISPKFAEGYLPKLAMKVAVLGHGHSQLVAKVKASLVKASLSLQQLELQ